VEVRQTDATSVEVEVADNGPGIPEDVLPHLFQPFFTTKAKGMGIGLTISNTIIEAHHGKLWAVNDPAGGARFCFTLPVMTGVPALPAAS
jgi:signal transduction histidine kinase